ncbi:hypothetical protein E2C01_064677 [Portunus trituberculatus]|uniref:Uncharacterized protein n=1 Tax=Portunus trituberculatus TaxID=210409 RepID=A0A5B7HMH9_PORTR|nr:hypothetical protein [Portunus trituberculatus]
MSVIMRHTCVPTDPTRGQQLIIPTCYYKLLLLTGEYVILARSPICYVTVIGEYDAPQGPHYYISQQPQHSGSYRGRQQCITSPHCYYKIRCVYHIRWYTQTQPLKESRYSSQTGRMDDNCTPTEQQARCSTPSRPNQQQNNYSKGGHNSQTETGEHPEQPSNTCLHPVPETKSACVYLC